jgi:type II secretory pathway pseudopilin PulG
LEILIVVLVIGVLLTMAVPRLLKGRGAARTKACISNMRHIDQAKQQWAMDTGARGSDTPTDTQVSAYLQGGKQPVCPEGNSAYIITPVDFRTTCPNVGSFPNHVQP